MDDSRATPEVSPRPERPTPHIVTTSTKKKRQVTVVGDSLLRGTEGPVCRADPPFREVCCLTGAHVKDVTRKLPSLTAGTGVPRDSRRSQSRRGTSPREHPAGGPARRCGETRPLLPVRPAAPARVGSDEVEENFPQGWGPPRGRPRGLPSRGATGAVPQAPRGRPAPPPRAGGAAARSPSPRPPPRRLPPPASCPRRCERRSAGPSKQPAGPPSPLGRRPLPASCRAAGRPGRAGPGRASGTCCRGATKPDRGTARPSTRRLVRARPGPAFAAAFGGGRLRDAGDPPCRGLPPRGRSPPQQRPPEIPRHYRLLLGLDGRHRAEAVWATGPPGLAKVLLPSEKISSYFYADEVIYLSPSHPAFCAPAEAAERQEAA
ncbi:collagen alpha-1(I) chain-like [Grus americana]|uniref:collagen alpha-1(I) chain-like n=1 Tax=Grus americana TaxID=9117 RepID=UPI0024083553|nr:collagen alpha-1(I) chain-like [Grus americana]